MGGMPHGLGDDATSRGWQRRDAGSIALVAVLVVGLVSAAFGRSFDVAELAFGDGLAWLASSGSADGGAEIALADAAGGVAVRLGLPADGSSALRVEYVDGRPYVVTGDGDSRLTYSLDGASQKLGQPVKLASSIHVVAGGGRTYLVNSVKRSITEVDRTTFEPLGDSVEFDRPIRVAVDGKGYAYAVDYERGVVSPVLGDEKFASIRVADGSSDPEELEPRTIGSVVTIVVAEKDQTVVLSGGSTKMRVPLPAAGAITSIGRGEGEHLAITRWAGSRHQLQLVNVRNGTVGSVDLEGVGASEVKELWVTDRAAFVRMTSSEVVLVIDVATKQVQQVPTGLEVDGVDDAFVKDGRLWLNQRGRNEAVSIGSAGDLSRYEKRPANIPVTEVVPPVEPAPAPPIDPPSTPPGSSPATTPTQTPTNSPGSLGVTPGQDGSGPTSAGDGSPPNDASSGVSSPVAATSPPGAPTVEVTPGNRQAVISWQLSGSGGPATSVEVSYSLGERRTEEFDAAAGSAVIDGLKNGTEYTFSVTAKNLAGSSSAVLVRARPTSEVPEAPSEVTALPANDGGIDVSWEAADGNGHDVSGYSIFVSQKGSPAPLSPRLDQVAGLRATVPNDGSWQAGDTLIVQVAATTGSIGAKSAPIEVVSLTTPDSSRLGTTLVRSGAANAEADVACDLRCRGGENADLTVELVKGDPRTGAVHGTESVRGWDGTQRSFAFGGLPVNTTYALRVTLKNSIGTVTVIGPDVIATGNAPTLTRLAVTDAGDARVRVEWAVANNGEATTCGLQVHGQPRSADCTGAITVDIGTYNIMVNASVTATNQIGVLNQSASGATGLKRMLADGNHWGCPDSPDSPFCGPDVSRMNTTAWASDKVTIPHGTAFEAECQTVGDRITDPAPGGFQTTLWVRVRNNDGRPWMSAHYFGTNDFGWVVAGLPTC